MTRVDWTRYKSQQELAEATFDDLPPSSRFGMLVQSGPLVGDWYWYWFSDAIERRDFVAQCIALEEERDPPSRKELPVNRLLGRHVFGSSIDWVGEFDELVRGDTETAVKCREDFWSEYEPDEFDDPDADSADEAVSDAVQPCGGEECGGASACGEGSDPIPERLWDRFVASLYPDWRRDQLRE